jgi:transcriptional regulator with XRE-family HTH domain
MVVPKSPKKPKTQRSLVPPTQHTLAAARVILGISRAALAEISGVSLSTIARLEEGNGNPTAKNLNKLADALLAKGIRFKAADSEYDGGVLIVSGFTRP